jgi:uncharacterized membrane protein
MMREIAQTNGRKRQAMFCDGNQELVAKGLGWFSVGLGAAELFAPGGVAELIGVRNNKTMRALLRTYGVREMAAGVGILSKQRPAGWLWGRVAGDVVDLVTLGAALTSYRSNRARVATAAAAVIGVSALDVFCGKQLTEKSSHGRVDTSILVNRSPEEVYRYWRQLENLPTFMSWIESVQVTGDRSAYWKAKGPGGLKIEWDAQIVEDQPDSMIMWRSVEGSDVRIGGRVRFEPAPGGRGTYVKQQLQYSMHRAPLTHKILALFGDVPVRIVLENDLRQMKQILETGEIIKSDSSVHAGMHPAQPPSSEELSGQIAEHSILQPSLA